jgi:topoisomerase-4 subunit B
VEWAVAWFAGDGFTRSYCNTIPTPEGGTHEAGLRSVLLRGFKSYADLVGNKRASVITSDDIMTSCGAILSVFVREPEFVGQTKDRLASSEAIRIVDNAVRDAFDHWLAASPAQATQLLDWIVDRAEERLRRRKEKEISRKTATRKLRLPGKACRLQCSNPRGHGTLHRRGGLGGRLGQAGARPPHASHFTLAGKDPECRQRRARQDQPEPAALGPPAGAGL